MIICYIIVLEIFNVGCYFGIKVMKETVKAPFTPPEPEGSKEKKVDLTEENSIISKSTPNINMNKTSFISLALVFLTFIVGIYLVVSGKVSFSKGKDDALLPVSTVQIKFAEKIFKLNYDNYESNSIINIAKFEKNEKWQGDQDFDEDNAWEGESALLLSSRNNKKAEAFIPVKLDLDPYSIFKLVVYLKTDSTDLESTRLYFSNKDKTAYFSYPISNLSSGWNFLRIPKEKFALYSAEKGVITENVNEESSTGAKVVSGSFDWSKIEKVGVELVSRPLSTSTANFDNLTVLVSEDYLNDWVVSSPLFLDLVKTADNKVVLQGKNFGTSTALLKKLGGVSDFTFKAMLKPQKINDRSGLFIRGDYKTNYGYYFMIDGVNGNRWQIFKNGLVDDKGTTTILKNGIINNFAVEENKPLWLQVEAKGSNMNFSLSTDGKSFTKLGEVNDRQFKDGGVGIAVYDSGATQFDNFEFSQ